jgi:hypothetical protein
MHGYHRQYILMACLWFWGFTHKISAIFRLQGVLKSRIGIRINLFYRD